MKTGKVCLLMETDYSGKTVVISAHVSKYTAKLAILDWVDSIRVEYADEIADDLVEVTVGSECAYWSDDTSGENIWILEMELQ